MSIEQLHEATRQALLDFERQIRELRYELHNAAAEIGDLRDRLDAYECKGIGGIASPPV